MIKGSTEQVPRPPQSAIYLLTLAMTMFASLGLFGAVLFGLDQTGHLPPPSLSNRLCADEKLRFIRNHPPASPDLLVIGSSVAWRHFDGATYAAVDPGHTEFNGGVCGLNFRQTKVMTDWLLDNIPSIRSVLMIVAPPDAESCEREPTAIFNDQDARQYSFGKAWPGFLYLRYFDPISFVRNVRSIAAQRANKAPLDPLVFTPTGDGPLDTTATRDTLLYGAPTQFSVACFSALHGLAEQMAHRGLPFTVVMTPLSPAWKATVDSDGRSRRNLAHGIQQALSGTGAVFWNADAAYTPPAGAFTDAIHMRWSAIPAFTREVVAHIKVTR